MRSVAFRRGEFVSVVVTSGRDIWIKRHVCVTLPQETWQLLKSGQLNELEALIDNALENFGAQSHDGTD